MALSSLFNTPVNTKHIRGTKEVSKEENEKDFNKNSHLELPESNEKVGCRITLDKEVIKNRILDPVNQNITNAKKAVVDDWKKAKELFEKKKAEKGQTLLKSLEALKESVKKDPISDEFNKFKEGPINNIGIDLIVKPTFIGDYSSYINDHINKMSAYIKKLETDKENVKKIFVVYKDGMKQAEKELEANKAKVLKKYNELKWKVIEIPPSDPIKGKLVKDGKEMVHSDVDIKTIQLKKGVVVAIVSYTEKGQPKFSTEEINLNDICVAGLQEGGRNKTIKRQAGGRKLLDVLDESNLCE
ncbi:MAG: hypothetical protein Edafosvirus14_9 [Edafosvirus sp.]|uniref:Uncharacterized protein n=1 Tax=Edafosvirus sp. TaxID=2487765 RepID=A0A3G4ZU86_9VIRU|nr:MAG: hypothetical protein Edafosvirus14_9 [Edafosvirus sp.]